VNKSFPEWVKPLLNAAIVLFSVVLSLAAAELLARIYYSSLHGEAFFGLSPHEITVDPQKGWKASPLFTGQEMLRDASGHGYSLVLHQDENGFREFQDLREQPRILVIGDSLTQARYASDGRTWYAEVGKRLHAQIFAYGVGGYGTLQELMALEEFFDRVNPDGIILQVSTNDIINNSVDLERRSLINNNLMVRPYYRADGSIFYTLPARSGALGLLDALPSWVFESRLMRVLRGAVMKTYIRLFSNRSVEFAIAKDPSMLLYRDALAITEALFARIKAKIGRHPSFAFVVDDFAPIREDLQVLLHKVGFIVISDIPERLAEARRDGREVLAIDNVHWNEEGNKIVGEIVARDLSTWFPRQPELMGVARHN
jgi:lysophospholipase L1-like esterase